jgi:PAS domain S-box-containing protein
LVETCPDAIWIKKGPRIVFVNEALLRMLGARREQILGRSPLEFVDFAFPHGD